MLHSWLSLSMLTISFFLFFFLKNNMNFPLFYETCLLRAVFVLDYFDLFAVSKLKAVKKDGNYDDDRFVRASDWWTSIKFQ